MFGALLFPEATLTSYYFPAAFDDAFLLKLKRHAFLRGVAISGTAVGNNFTHPPGDKRNSEIADRLNRGKAGGGRRRRGLVRNPARLESNLVAAGDYRLGKRATFVERSIRKEAEHFVADRNPGDR